LSDDEQTTLLSEAGRMVADRFGISETTFQVETEDCENGDLLHAATHAHTNSHGNRNKHQH
jgi:hypothetical protein